MWRCNINKLEYKVIYNVRRARSQNGCNINKLEYKVDFKSSLLV